MQLSKIEKNKLLDTCSVFINQAQQAKNSQEIEEIIANVTQALQDAGVEIDFANYGYVGFLQIRESVDKLTHNYFMVNDKNESQQEMEKLQNDLIHAIANFGLDYIKYCSKYDHCKMLFNTLNGAALDNQHLAALLTKVITEIKTEY
ncbi:hypothetical protein M8332_00965 [Fructilactobacillus ixorae]|uniref:Uncharacterized protein n=1 Tax=Fructilactobacillus ixorae TaxID=1750535 RepID=A0ABY5C3V7_9LACO|nr:hypothetical protein [Fructilactobacillus ixorae]USS93470.1 hypothetical protein M8332_00965 [Fructilactobacillus ixorae]